MKVSLTKHNLLLADIAETSACEESIRLPFNEWKKARHFDDKFWLYIVTGAGSAAPQLHRIQNPAAHFRMDEDIFVTGFIVPEVKWRERTDRGLSKQ